MLDEAAERRAFQQAVAEWRGSGSTGAGSDPPANPPTRTIPPGRKSTTATTTHGQTLDDFDNEADSEGPASWLADVELIDTAYSRTLILESDGAVSRLMLVDARG
jgi:hypothetical protein